jgi:hypothetical protein
MITPNPVLSMDDSFAINEFLQPLKAEASFGRLGTDRLDKSFPLYTLFSSPMKAPPGIKSPYGLPSTKREW